MGKNRKVNISDLNYLDLEKRIIHLDPVFKTYPKAKEHLFKNVDYSKGYSDAINEALHVLKEELG